MEINGKAVGNLLGRQNKQPTGKLKLNHGERPVRRLTQKQKKLIDQAFEDTKAEILETIEHKAYYVTDSIELAILCLGYNICDIYKNKKK